MPVYGRLFQPVPHSTCGCWTSSSPPVLLAFKREDPGSIKSLPSRKSIKLSIKGRLNFLRYHLVWKKTFTQSFLHSPKMPTHFLPFNVGSRPQLLDFSFTWPSEVHLPSGISVWLPPYPNSLEAPVCAWSPHHWFIFILHVRKEKSMGFLPGYSWFFPLFQLFSQENGAFYHFSFSLFCQSIRLW